MRVVVKKQRPQFLLKDAETLYGYARDEMKSNIRDAAEKAWGAVVRATDALIVARTGITPEGPEAWGQREEAFRRLRMENPQYDRIIDRLYAKAGTLHGECFYRGQCEPKSSYEEKIRETESFIEDIRKLIGA